MYDPNTLTGAQVMEVRNRHGLSRDKFSEMAGFTGKSTARLNNIEKKDSWKSGDRVAVARALNLLESGESSWGPREPLPGIAVFTPTSTAPHGPVVLTTSDDVEEPDDWLASVTGPMTPSQVVDTIQLPLHVLVPDAPNGVYRLSNSELQTWKRCRRKWWLAWYRELVLQTESFTGVRSTGTRIHKALQAWYVPEGQQRVDPRDALERVIVEDWTKIAHLAVERGTHEEKLAELATEFAASTNLERAMVEGYVQWLEETGVDAELRIIASETPLVADLEATVNGEQVPVQFIGLLDARTYRVTDGVRLFVDHKTVGDLNAPVMTLPQNEQMLHYHLLELLGDTDFEERCDGALYNMLRRVKRSARAKPPFYERIEVRHNAHELASYKRRALAATTDILNATQALNEGRSHLDVVYPTPTGNCRWDCDFFAVCNMLDDGSKGADDMINAFFKVGNPRTRYHIEDRKA